MLLFQSSLVLLPAELLVETHSQDTLYYKFFHLVYLSMPTNVSTFFCQLLGTLSNTRIRV